MHIEYVILTKYSYWYDIDQIDTDWYWTYIKYTQIKHFFAALYQSAGSFPWLVSYMWWSYNNWVFWTFCCPLYVWNLAAYNFWIKSRRKRFFQNRWSRTIVSFSTSLNCSTKIHYNLTITGKFSNRIKNTIFHPNFRSQSLDFDICLIRKVSKLFSLHVEIVYCTLLFITSRKFWTAYRINEEFQNLIQTRKALCFQSVR